MERQHFAHLRADCHVRRQTGQRVLKNHRHPRATDIAKCCVRSLQHIGAIEINPAGCSAIARQQTQSRERRLALPGAAFADNAEAFALGDVETYTFDSLNHTVRCVEGNTKIFDRKNSHAGILYTRGRGVQRPLCRKRKKGRAVGK